MARSSSPPYSKTVADTANRCATYGVAVPLRTCPPHEHASRTEARDQTDLSELFCSVKQPGIVRDSLDRYYFHASGVWVRRVQ